MGGRVVRIKRKKDLARCPGDWTETRAQAGAADPEKSFGGDKFPDRRLWHPQVSLFERWIMARSSYTGVKWNGRSVLRGDSDGALQGSGWAV